MSPQKPKPKDGGGEILEPSISLQTSQQAVDFRQILNTAIAAISYFQVFENYTWKCHYCSDACQGVYGYSPDWLMAHPKRWLARMVADDRQTKLPRLWQEIIAERASAVELRFRQPDGTIHWLWVTISSQRQRTAAGWWVTLTAIDITSQRQIEEALRASEEQFCLLAHSVPVFLWMTSSEPLVTFVNQSWLDFTGRTPEAELGYGWMETIHPDDRSSCIQRLHEAFQRRQVFLVEYRHRRVDGEYRWILNTGVPRFATDGTFKGYVGSCLDISDRKQAELMTQQAMEREQQIRERERLIATIAQNVRQSLDLNQILTTAVEEVRRFLDVDRVVIYQFDTTWHGTVIAESILDETYSIRGQRIHDTCFAESMGLSYQQGHIHTVNDILTADLDPCYINLLQELNVRAVLVIPILVREELWGLLIAHHCSDPFQWQQVSWYLLRQLSVQVAIAIQQCQLYQSVQQLNLELEQQVQLRTTELHQSLEFEALLKRITDKVRDSLDEDQILQTAVNELGQGLDIVCCNTGIYDANYTTSTISHEYTLGLEPSRGRVIPLAKFSHLYSHLLQRQPCQFCSAPSNPAPSTQKHYAILACPIVDDHGILGDLWVFKAQDQVFSDLEVRIVQQVANHCAIALRQSRLYQASQAQVKELERLNHLKDDFLSTVSHELRTPMTNIKLAIQMMETILFNQQHPDASEPYTLSSASFQRLSRYFQILQGECQREILLINNLLDLSEFDADMEPLNPVALDLHQWLPPLIHPFSERAARHHQRLQLDLPATLPPLFIDPSYLERILIELLDNACKYTPPQEQIILSACIRPEETKAEDFPNESLAPLIPLASQGDGQNSILFQISVTNTGVEIPEQERDRIFEKFYRIPDHDPWKHGGTGLGLALVKKLAARLDATIELESRVGQTIFILTKSLTPLY